MALYATLAVTVKQPSLADATVQVDTTFYFRGAKTLYEDAGWSTATGIKDVSATHGGEVILSEIGDLLLHGALRTCDVEIGNDGSKPTMKRVRYNGNKDVSATEAAIKLLTWKGSGKYANAKVRGVSEPRKKIVE